MATINDILRIHDNIANQCQRLSTSISFSYNILEKFNPSHFTLPTYYSTSNLSIRVANQVDMINKFSNILNNDVFQNMNHICNKLSFITSNYDLDDNVTDVDDLLLSINDFSEYVEKNFITTNDDETSFSPETISNNVKTNNSIDWKFIIGIILTLLSLSLQISDKIEKSTEAKNQQQFQYKIIDTLDKINNCLENNSKK